VLFLKKFKKWQNKLYLHNKKSRTFYCNVLWRKIENRKIKTIYISSEIIVKWKNFFNNYNRISYSNDISNIKSRIRVNTCGFKCISAKEKKTVLFTEGIRNCVAVTFWNPITGTLALFHFSWTQPLSYIKDYYLPIILRNSPRTSEFKVNVVSFFYSQNLKRVIGCLEEEGFIIDGIDCNDAVIEKSETHVNYFIDNKNLIFIDNDDNFDIVCPINKQRFDLGKKVAITSCGGIISQDF